MKMLDKSFFSLRTSFFNTNIQSAGPVPELLLSEDRVDNTTKKKRRQAARPAGRNNANNNTNNNANNNNSNNNANSNNQEKPQAEESTIVEVTVPAEEDQDNNTAEEENENSDQISDLLGHFGWWQFIWCVTLSLFQFPSTFHLFSFVFEGATQDFWCARPEHLKGVPIQLWKNLTQPKDACSIVDVDFDRLAIWNFTNINFHGLPLRKCGSFEYDLDLIGKTVISEWTLVCGRASMVSVVEMCFLAGAAAGSLMSGWISDQFGRRYTLLIFATIQTIVGILLAFSSTLAMFMTLRFVSGITSMAVLVVSFVLVVELVSGSYRTVVGILNLLPLPLSYIIISGISYAAQDWRKIQLCGTIPCCFLLLLWFNLPESPRWLLARGRIEQLASLMRRIALRNNITLEENFQTQITAPANANENVSIITLFNSTYRNRTLTMAIIWFSLILLYFGITLHMNALGGNIFTNTLMAGGVEAAAIIFSIFVVLKLGIRINLVVYMYVAGIACLMVNFVPEGDTTFLITLVLIGKCTIGATNAIIQTFTAYQYPTQMRNLGVGAGNFAAGIALIIVPYLWLLEKTQIYLPMTIMGCFGLIGGTALIILEDRSPGSGTTTETNNDEDTTTTTTTNDDDADDDNNDQDEDDANNDNNNNNNGVTVNIDSDNNNTDDNAQDDSAVNVPIKGDADQDEQTTTTNEDDNTADNDNEDTTTATNDNDNQEEEETNNADEDNQDQDQDQTDTSLGEAGVRSRIPKLKKIDKDGKERQPKKGILKNFPKKRTTTDV